MKLVIISILIATSAAQFNNVVRVFSAELLRHAETETNGHNVLSPFGIWTVMAGVAVCATGNSQKQLATAMKLPQLNLRNFAYANRNLTDSLFQRASSDVTMINKNFMFLDRRFNYNARIQYISEGYFGTQIEALDFQNSTAASQSANRIIYDSGTKLAQVLKPEDFEDSKIILTNVITFKGGWQSAFQRSATFEEPFYDNNERQIGKVNMMYQSIQVAVIYVKGIHAEVLELPYGNDGKFSMLIALPVKSKSTHDVYKGLQTTDLKDIINDIQKEVDEERLTSVDIRIPRFKISTVMSLNDILRAMGITDIFDPLAAHFGNLTPEKVYVNNVIHKAEIEVAETGTVASASTSANFADRILSSSFTANKPFVYLLVEKPSASLIFAGTYSNPSVY